MVAVDCAYRWLPEHQHESSDSGRFGSGPHQIGDAPEQGNVNMITVVMVWIEPGPSPAKGRQRVVTPRKPLFRKDF